MYKNSNSKSLFNIGGASSGGGAGKSMINPIRNTSIGTGTTFSSDFLNSLRAIEKSYTSNLANGTYSNIPADYIEFSKLYSQVTKIQLGVLDSTISILLNITKEGLKGAMNALGLSNQVLEANVARIELQNQVNKLEAGFNQLNIYSNTSGQYQITKTFTLIPLYSYYILLYGLPAHGVGFDPLKVSQLLSVLQANNIDPYNE